MPTATKLELIRRLGEAGLPVIEAGAFVSPKWVPQMGDTPELLRNLKPRPNVSYPVLVPNAKGLSTLQALLAEHKGTTNEIAIFTAASESFCKANTNCTIAESLERLQGVVETARSANLAVRGYVSVVAGCPYEGAVDPKKVADVSAALLDMGCYEVSLGDTIGAGTPSQLEAVLNACVQRTNRDETIFAAHCHDTFGTGLANVLHLVRLGVRTVDASAGGLGGCPYSPGATGNIDTESVVNALHQEGFQTGVDLDQLAQIGDWISSEIGRPNASSAGRAILARKQRAKL